LSRRYRAYVISAPAESLEAEYPDKAVNYAFPVFPYPARKIYRSADVKDAVQPIGHDVKPRAFHQTADSSWMAGSSPAKV